MPLFEAGSRSSSSGCGRANLQVMVVARPDATRLAARDRARALAATAGRAAIFDEAATAARETTLRSFASAGFSGTWAATEMSASVASATDRIAAAAAFEEAAMAAVVEDLADDDTLEVLRATSDELDRSAGIPVPGSLATFTAQPGLTADGPRQMVRRWPGASCAPWPGLHSACRSPCCCSPLASSCWRG